MKQKEINGIPSWIVLTTEDPKAATQFYGALLGWKNFDAVAPNSFYEVQHLQGIPVSAISQRVGSLEPKWRIHIDVAALEEITKIIVTAGGKIVQEPISVGNEEKYAVFADPSGVEFAVHHGKVSNGTEILNASGAFGWSELITDDIHASYAFYNTVFGWALSEPLQGDKLGRREWLANRYPIAGLLPRPAAMPKEIAPYWDVFFSVNDPAVTVENVISLGGKNLMAPIEIPHGEIAVFIDPAGIVFSVIKPKK
jgi:predicted enzyme related to lactoylglutathione lyase